jgi:hypothetical protein
MPPIAHAGHVCASSIVLFVALCQDDVLVQSGGKTTGLVGFNPAIVVEASFDIAAVFVAVEPDVCYKMKG